MAAKTAAVCCFTWRIFNHFSPQAPFRPRSLSTLSSRQSSSKQGPREDKSPKRSNFRPEASTTHDWIGPPNPLSNLRPIVYHIPENETDLEKRLRKLRQDTEDWNHEFWAKQNITFSKEKEAFIVSQLKAKGLSAQDEEGRRRSLNTEEMASFYKRFLDDNRIKHANYNKEWYRRNFTITFLMAQVALCNIWKAAVDQRSGKKKNNHST
ncbi:cytochrome c oxidase assembly factor 8 [Thalassophryne amazonica]|uniref:cytochrome c oxidase assembly factor 8 n=1 Tax=Thalassophryne amazonica TaxID=390379 RepID=UPI0014722534|nr:cytochrome c oxidase assembly factor 8 [Thalassophryne amazonica]